MFLLKQYPLSKKYYSYQNVDNTKSQSLLLNFFLKYHCCLKLIDLTKPSLSESQKILQSCVLVNMRLPVQQTYDKYADAIFDETTKHRTDQQAIMAPRHCLHSDLKQMRILIKWRNQVQKTYQIYIHLMQINCINVVTRDCI